MRRTGGSVGAARRLTASGLRMTSVDSSPSPRIFAHVCTIVSCDAMLVTIAPMIAKNKLRDLCRGAIVRKKENLSQSLAFALALPKLYRRATQCTTRIQETWLQTGFPCQLKLVYRQKPVPSLPRSWPKPTVPDSENFTVCAQ
jgi:hypothetical protein